MTTSASSEVFKKRLNFSSLSPKTSSSIENVVSAPIPSLPATAETATSVSKVPVYLRIRPCATSTAIVPLDDCRVKTVSGKITSEFSFTRVFPSTASQTEMFQHVAGSVIDQFLTLGKDGLIFAYGVTNSGKTYTVQGTKENPGIIPQTLDRIFSSSPAAADVCVSYLQIYNDQIQDLQDVSLKNLKVKVREDSVLVEGLKETAVSSSAEGLKILDRGTRIRTREDNGVNSSSSRSHTVFIIRMNKAKLHIVDLAGSERGKRTKLTGLRQVEATMINSSLSHLMGCLNAMRINQRLAKLYPNKPTNKPPFRPIPFRECKLTLLFRNCLKASQGVVMIVNASPDPLDFEETQHALRYGELTRSTCLLNEHPTLLDDGNSATNNVNNNNRLYDYNGRKKIQPPMGVSQTPTVQRLLKISSPISKSAGKIKIHFDLESPMDPLEEENFNLRRDLVEAKLHFQQMERELRNELAREMESQLKEMTERFETRLKRLTVADHHPPPSQAPTMSQSQHHAEDLAILAEQVTECEEEMERMRTSHALEIESLQRELTAALRLNASSARKESLSSASVPPGTPWMVAEERKRIKKLMIELEEEREAHMEVISDRSVISNELDRVLEREEALKARVLYLEQQQQQQQSLKASSAFALSGSAPGLLLSKRKKFNTVSMTKDNEENIIE